MWGQNWMNIFDLLWNDEKNSKTILSELKEANLSPHSIMKLAERFFISIGFPAMPKRFWEFSRVKNNKKGSCHGKAFNMFRNRDFRQVWKIS